MLAKEREVRRRNDIPRIGIVGLLLIQANQLPRFLVRQRGEEDRLDDTEDGGCAADAQAKCRDHNGSVAGAAADLPKCVAHIIEHLLEPEDAVHLVDVLPEAGGIAELTPCGDVRLVR